MKLNLNAPAATIKPVIAEGVYDFVVGTSVSGVSNAGNDMIAIKLLVNDAEGKSHQVADYLVGERNPDKVVAFCRATGLLHLIKDAEIAASQLIGARGRCVIGIRPANGKYRESNEVKSYLPGGPKPLLTVDQMREMLAAGQAQ